MIKKIYPAIHHFLVVLTALLTLSTVPVMANEKTVALTESELNALIDARIEKALARYQLDNGGFDAKVEKSIIAFIGKQQDEQRRQQAEVQQRQDAKAKYVKPVDPKQDHIYGDPKAPVSLIEYSDFECPFCKRFHLTAKKLIDDNPGKINWVYRHFPLQFHNPGAQKQAEASECAAELGGNDAFWAYTNLIYERTKAGGKGFPIAALTPLAVEIGLPKAPFAECLESEKYAQKVKQDFAEGAKAGISGTPGNILRHNASGEVVVVSGAQPYERLQQALDNLNKVVAKK